MERFFNYFFKGLFAGSVLNIIYKNAISLETVGLVLVVGAFSFLHDYFANNKKLTELTEELESYKASTEAKFVEQEQMIRETVASVASVKIGAGMRQRRAANE